MTSPARHPAGTRSSQLVCAETAAAKSKNAATQTKILAAICDINFIVRL
jgi:hypothetical protein